MIIKLQMFAGPVFQASKELKQIGHVVTYGFVIAYCIIAAIILLTGVDKARKLNIDIKRAVFSRLLICAAIGIAFAGLWWIIGLILFFSGI